MNGNSGSYIKGVGDNGDNPCKPIYIGQDSNGKLIVTTDLQGQAGGDGYFNGVSFCYPQPSPAK